MSPPLRSLLTRVQPAGVILLARNISEAGQTRALLRDCQACVATPLFTCVDMEGGRVDRFRDVIGPASSAAAVFATGDRNLFRRHGRIIGECCRALGLNTDLAPVVDLALPASRQVMSSRAVSADPREAVVYARAFLAGLREANVIGCGKHFPGLGEARLDTHHELPQVAKPWKELWREDLYPFRALRRQFPMVLVNHASYPSVTHDAKPASLSEKWITGVLCKKIGYRGLVLSDDLEMGAIVKSMLPGEAAVEHIRAGGDLCLICHTEELITRSWEALRREAVSDRKFALRARDAVQRVLAFKRTHRSQLRPARTPSSMRVRKLARQLWECAEQVRLEAISSRTEQEPA